MNDRLKSAIATVLIHAVLGYAIVMGLAMSISRHANDRMTLINLSPDRALPPPQRRPPPPPKVVEPPIDVTLIPTPRYEPPWDPSKDWVTMTPEQRAAAVAKTHKWVVEYVEAARARVAAWRADVPQGTGPAKVTRLVPANLPTHTLYWPASWSKGKLPIIAWGNGSNSMCFNSSLEYAGFLGEIASHGYFVVAIGNDDIEYQPGGPEILPDGRGIRTRASALTKGVDWAIAENSRAGSPYQGKLDTSKIAYMGHACGGQQAMDASSADPRTTTTVLLNAAARFRPRPSDPDSDTDSHAYKPPIAHFEGWQDDGGVVGAGESNFARAQAAGWPMFMAALVGMGHDEAYPEPDKRWTKAVLAWLDWQLKGDNNGLATIQGLWRDNWTSIGATGF